MFSRQSDFVESNLDATPSTQNVQVDGLDFSYDSDLESNNDEQDVGADSPTHPVLVPSVDTDAPMDATDQVRDDEDGRKAVRPSKTAQMLNTDFPQKRIKLDSGDRKLRQVKVRDFA